MLSILIPTYNHICVKLVADLQRQAENLECAYEILVADDASEESYKSKNREINHIPHCQCIELPKNVGRSRIRNILGFRARYGYLLFMDCDAAVTNDKFLARYMAVREQAQVIYGGLAHPSTLPSSDVTLAYRYEKHAEPRHTVEKRRQHPYASFRTFNFMIARDTFLKHPFDETIVHYGHEDTLFGKSLKENGIGILHIDNPLMNCGLDTNATVVSKTEMSLKMLYAHREKLAGTSGVLSLHDKLRRWHLLPLARGLFRLSRPMVRKNLLSRHPSLHLFAFYKIGYYCQWEHGTH